MTHRSSATAAERFTGITPVVTAVGGLLIALVLVLLITSGGAG
jgi:hypothetical protein